MAARTTHSVEGLRRHILHHDTWRNFRQRTEDERSSSSAAERVATHHPQIQQDVIHASAYDPVLWDHVLFAIDCLLQGLQQSLAGSAGGSGTQGLGRGRLLPPDFQATIAAISSRMESVRDGFTVRYAYSAIVKDLLTTVVARDISSCPTKARLNRYVSWWELYKVFCEFTRRLLSFHDRDAVARDDDAELQASLLAKHGVADATAEVRWNSEATKAQNAVSKVRRKSEEVRITSLMKRLRYASLKPSANVNGPLSKPAPAARTAVLSLSASAIGNWRDVVFVPLVVQDEGFRSAIWDVVNSQRDQGSETPESVQCIRAIVASTKAVGCCDHPEFYRIGNFVDPTLVNDRSQFELMAQIPLIQAYLKEPPTFLDRQMQGTVSLESDDRNKAVVNFDQCYDLLESEFLVSSAAYFRARREEWLSEQGATLVSYLNKAKQLHQAELRRTTAYLDKTRTWQKMDLLLAEEFLLAPQRDGGKLLGIGDADSRIEVMLQQGQRESLAIVFEAFLRMQQFINPNFPEAPPAEVDGPDCNNANLGLAPLVRAFAAHAKSLCRAVSDKHLRALPEAAGSPQRTIPIGEYKHLELIFDLIQALRTLQGVVEEFSALPSPFEVVISATFEKVMNSKRVSGPQALSLFVDAVLRDALPSTCFGNGGARVRDGQISNFHQELCKSAVTLFSFLYDKDVFQEYFTEQLRSRLLANKADTYDFSKGAEMEMFFLQLLLQEHGIGFVSRMQRMIDDIESETARSTETSFKEWVSEQRLQLADSDTGDNHTATRRALAAVPKSLGVLALTKSVWPPTAVTSVCDTAVKKVAPSLRACEELFSQYYSKRFPARQLGAHWEVTRVVLQAKFPRQAQPTTPNPSSVSCTSPAADGTTPKKAHKIAKKKSSGTISYEFHVSGLQCTLLNAFTQKRKTGLTLQDFAREFGFETQPVKGVEKAFLLALLRTFTFDSHSSSARHVPAGCSSDKPLIKQSAINTTKDSNSRTSSPIKAHQWKFSLNKKFRSKSTKVVFATPDFSDVARLSGTRQLDSDAARDPVRLVTVGAAIVRIMKSRGTMTHADLFSEVCDDVTTFRVSKRMFNKQVTQLIATDYIQRDDLDSAKYLYIA